MVREEESLLRPDVSRFTHHGFPMRIGIDIRAITAAGQGRGLGIYAANLVKHLLQIDQQNQYFLFIAWNQEGPAVLSPLPPNAMLVRLGRPTRNIFVWDQLLWYPLFKRLRIDVFHSLVYGVPFLCPCPRILTIHDVTPIIFPRFIHSFRHRFVFRFNFFTGKFADRVITASTHSRYDLRHHLGISESKLTVVFDGVGPQYRVLSNHSELDDVKSRYGILGKFVLYVGGFDPHKNLPTLVKAFALLRRQYEWQESLSLVFVGKLSPAADAVRSEVAAQHIEEHVVFTDYVPEDDAVRLFNAAEVFVLPSFYEGFGLPVLEAMACGTLVVCSNAASLPEVVGNAAIQCSPESPQEFCDAMRNVLVNQTLQEDLRQKGLARVKQFSWDNTARQTLGVYESVMCNA